MTESFDPVGRMEELGIGQPDAIPTRKHATLQPLIEEADGMSLHFQINYFNPEKETVDGKADEVRKRIGQLSEKAKDFIEPNLLIDRYELEQLEYVPRNNVFAVTTFHPNGEPKLTEINLSPYLWIEFGYKVAIAIKSHLEKPEV